MQSFKRFQERMDRYVHALDLRLLVPVILMSAIGLYCLHQVLLDGYGAGSYPANFIKQLGAVLVGLCIALLFAMAEGPSLRLLAWIIYGAGLLLLIYVKVDGFSLRASTGADSWIRLPFIGSFQPSELAKVGIAMLGANVFARLKRSEISTMRAGLSLAIIYGLPLLFILTEPDFGTAFVIVVMALSSVFIFGLDWRYILGFAGLGSLAFPLLWFFYLTDTQKGRLLTFLFPGHHVTASYHIEQSLKAVASGGMLGNLSGMKVYVPVKESDFIFSAVSEELGFVGTTSLLLLVAFFILRAIYLAWQAAEADALEDSFLVLALTAAMGFHIIENMGMNVGLLPITGIPLPFVSNGGTSMIVNYIALGIMLNVSMNLRHKGFT